MTPRAVSGRVSVIIPTYNAERFVGAAISSALTQTHPDVEVVVVDDGSTDGTAKVIAGYGDRVVFVQQENRGPSAARNAGIRASSGALLALCDSDDVLLPPHIERAIEVLSRDGGTRRWVTTDAWALRDDGIDWGRRVLYYRQSAPAEQLDDFLAVNVTSMFAVFPRELFDEVDGYDEQLSYCEDWDFWLRAVLAGWRVVFQNEPTALYRSSPGSLSSSTDKMGAGHERVLRKALDEQQHPLTDKRRRDVEERLEHPPVLELVPQADALLRAGDVDGASRLYALAVRLNPADVRLRRKAAVLRVAPARLLRPVLARRGVIMQTGE